MVKYPPLKVRLAFALSVAAALWLIPASASESSGTANETAVTRVIPAAAIVADNGDTPRLGNVVKSDVARAPLVGKAGHVRHRWTASRVRTAASHWRQRFRETVSRSECPGTWCGRHFVLLLGIGF